MGSWDARDPPFCKPFLTKQARTGGENAMTFQSKQTSTLTLTQCDPPFEKSWLSVWYLLSSEIVLLQLRLFVALDLVEQLYFFLLNPDLTMMAVGRG